MTTQCEENNNETNEHPNLTEKIPERTTDNWGNMELREIALSRKEQTNFLVQYSTGRLENIT